MPAVVALTGTEVVYSISYVMDKSKLTAAEIVEAEEHKPLIGNRLKLARSAAGRSLRALEGRIGRRVTAQAIGRRRTTIGWNELFDLKRIFGVSVQSLVYRCRDLRIINDALFGRLFRDMSRFGWRSPPYREPRPLAQERPSRFERLCSRALAENVISDAKAAELLRMSVRELYRWMEPPSPR